MKVYLVDSSEDLEKLILYGQIKNEKKKDLTKNSWKLRVNSFIVHISREKSCLRPPLVKKIDNCFDNNSLYELKIRLSDNLVRIFFVYYQNSIIMFNLLVKPAYYEKQMKKEVDKNYNIKIKEAKQLYKCFIGKRIKLKEYIKII